MDRDQKNADVTLSTIREEGGEAAVFVGDVTSTGDCAAMAEAAVDNFGKLNVLINNVGHIRAGIGYRCRRRLLGHRP